MRPPPGLLNPFEYKERMHALIYDGEPTDEMKAEMEKARVERAKDSVGKALPPPRTELDELKRMREQAAELLAKKQEREAANK